MSYIDFFLSSRRRHTRSKRDWSSDVCSSDLVVSVVTEAFSSVEFQAALQLWAAAASDPTLRTHIVPMEERIGREIHRATVELLRSEERRVGKEWGAVWLVDHCGYLGRHAKAR